MDESVALDSSKQKNFVKSVRGIKKLLKKKDKKPVDGEVVEKSEVRNEGRIFKKRINRGLVYLSHIPHGFYEQQMTEYFKQFGVVTNARVIRSKRSGNSKGFAFVEFKEPAVAQIVAETMNNYLMGKRLIKAAYIPPEKQKIHALRKKWNSQSNPALEARLKFKKMHNADKSVDEELKTAKKLLSNLTKTKKKLNDLGIDFGFFKPVDVPEALKDVIDNINLQKDIKINKQVKNENAKTLKSDNTVKEGVKTQPEIVTKFENSKKKNKKQPKQRQTENNIICNINENLKAVQALGIHGRKKPKKENKVQIKDSENKVKSEPENFISITEPDDSNSSIDFDSDEFEKIMENDDDISSGDESSQSEIESEEIKKLNKKGFKKAGTVFQDQLAKLDSGVQKKENVKTQTLKRKKRQLPPAMAKKAKFEKKNKRQLNKGVMKRK